MSESNNAIDDQSGTDSIEQRLLTALEEQNEKIEQLEQENAQIKTQLDQQQNDGLPNVSRRQTLGLLGGGALLGAAGTASAQSDDDGDPFADEDHDHSSDYLGEGEPVGHIDTDKLHAKSLSNIKIVGPDGYDSIQAAHDDLPQSGGQIWLTKEVAETDIVFTKWTKLVGGGAGLASGGGGGRKPRIDTSGGNGIHIKAPDCTMRDVLIAGDKTGGYGLKLGVKGKFRGRYTIDNVAVHDKGGHGIDIVGSHLNDKLDINARNCGGNGWNFDFDGYFNENLIQRMGANRCDGHGIYINGQPFEGNTVDMLWSEDNKGWGMIIDGPTNVSGCKFKGYGIEQTGPNAGQVLHAPNVGIGNTLEVRKLIVGEINAKDSYEAGEWTSTGPIFTTDSFDPRIPG